jgi:quercetin dioxygenase-like cupin family protein
MKSPEFPRFIRNLPRPELPLEDAEAWIMQGDNGQILLLQVNHEQRIAEHAHGDQWGIVIEGEMELTIGGKAETYRRGDSYFIPAGTPHNALLYKGFRALDLFADKNRYSLKTSGRQDRPA